MKKILFIVLAVILSVNFAKTCTTFVIKDKNNLVFGRNYDFGCELGFVVVNRKGISKQSFSNPPHLPTIWVAKYGSVTFNQIGVDMPMGGMNEKRLVIAQMALYQDFKPKVENKTILSELEWIQYQLDNSATLDEVIENNKKICIVPFGIPLHYMVCDSLGNIGIVEIINGEFKVYQGDEIKIPVCSNISYQQSKKSLKLYPNFGGEKAIPDKWIEVPDIIAISNEMIKNFNSKNNKAVDYSFDILKKVGSEEYTQWSLVFDLKKGEINFKTHSNKKMKVIHVNDLIESFSKGIYTVDIKSIKDNVSIKKQFSNLTKKDYFEYKMKVIKWYSENIPGFPKIPEQVVNQELDYIFNRNKIKKLD